MNPRGQAKLFHQRYGRRSVSLGGVTEKAGSSPAVFVPLTLASGSPAPGGGQAFILCRAKRPESLSDLL